MITRQQAIHYAATEVKAKVSMIYLSNGLCSHIRSIGNSYLDKHQSYLSHITFKNLDELIAKWPLRVTEWGPSYPVPHPGLSARDAYQKYATECLNMYDINTEYGRNRLALLDFIIEATREKSTPAPCSAEPQTYTGH